MNRDYEMEERISERSKEDRLHLFSFQMPIKLF